MTMKILLATAFFIFLFSPAFSQKVVRYDLYVRDTMVNFTGKQKRAIAVNGQIPMPTLDFVQGDTAEIYVHNEMDEETSLHWHGLMLPNKEDGVPWLTQQPIPAHGTHLYRFPIIQHGTHWYHSHTGLQEQIGMYGSMILHPPSLKLATPLKPPAARGRRIDSIPELPVIISEWTDYNPDNVERMLHNATDWFALRKNAVQSYGEAIQAKHFKTKITNEWKRMLAMDVSDVYYDKILFNGLPAQQIKQPTGSKLRLRISNAGASSYFWLRYAGGKIAVVAHDGNDVEPVEVDRLIIAVSETYDIVVQVPADSSYEFMATTEDRTNSASMFIGSGPVKHIDPLPRLDYFEGMKMMNSMMKMNGDLDDMGMSMSLNKMDMNNVMYRELKEKGKPRIKTLNYAMMKAPEETTLPEGPVKEIRFELTGNMNRYVWSMDNKVVSETDKILIKKGENVRMVIYNGSMMRHPMHLHGHDFRLLNGQGAHAPLMNVVDIMPMETDTLEFHANAEGDWFFHCHILYHMMSGMGRVFTYQNQAPNPLLPDPSNARRKLYADDRMFHGMAENDFATNGNDGMLMVQNTRWSIGTEWRLGYNDMHGYETETHIGRYIGKMQWLMPFIGFDWRYRRMGMGEMEKNLFGQTNTKDQRAQLTVGLQYTLPMLVKAQAELFMDGNFRIQFMREDIPLTKRLRGSFMWNTDTEWMAGMRYIIGRYWSAGAHYDSDMGFGVGVVVNY